MSRFVDARRYYKVRQLLRHFCSLRVTVAWSAILSVCLSVTHVHPAKAVDAIWQGHSCGLNVSLLMRVFVVYVRPIIEYCSVVWSSSPKQDTESVEKVQRHSNKRQKGLRSMSYAERLRYLDVPSSELRHLHLDCYYIIFGIVRFKVI